MWDGWPLVGQPDPEAAPDAPKDPGWEVDVKSFPRRPSVLEAWRHRSSEAGNRQRKLDQYARQLGQDEEQLVRCAKSNDYLAWRSGG